MPNFSQKAQAGEPGAFRIAHCRAPQACYTAPTPNHPRGSMTNENRPALGINTRLAHIGNDPSAFHGFVAPPVVIPV